jgi:hypothetical protein
MVMPALFSSAAIIGENAPFPRLSQKIRVAFTPLLPTILNKILANRPGK